MEVYVVTYWDGESEPVVTVFNNESAAQKCAEYFQANGEENVVVDKTQVYSRFLSGDEVEQYRKEKHS